MVNNVSMMQKTGKFISLILTLVIWTNGVFAAQMTASMVADSTELKTSFVQEQSPCHSEQSADSEIMNCCSNDCTGCVLSVSMPSLLITDLFNLPHPKKFEALSNHQLPSHASNLYRPPILI